MVKEKQSTHHTLLEEDRLSSLPDCLLVDIISRLPYTKQAIRTGTLSKRWQHLWPQVPNVIIKPEFRHDSPQFYSSIESITSQRGQWNLNKFHLHASYTNRTKSQLNNCICNAINRNVQEVDLYLSLYPCVNYDNEFLLPECFFISSSLIHLTLSKCAFEQADIISWKNLKSLSVTYGYLDEDLIANILSGSPLLETLELVCCYGFQRIDIANKSVKNLARSPIKYADPKVQRIRVEESMLAYEISLAFRLHDQMHEAMLKGLILSLGHVNELELKVGESCLEALACLQAKGFIFPSNLKVLQEIDSD
ncbi:F-box/LRR-repeat protein 25-like protein [Tanacetum coccineum]